MRMLADMANRFRQDEDGAAMVEYTVLLGIITAGVIASVILVSGWVNTEWSGLNTTLRSGTTTTTGG